MKKSEIYTSAAKSIFTGQQAFSCLAILSGGQTSKYSEACLFEFKELFKPQLSGQVWFGDEMDEENQLARQLALLLMAEIEKGNE